MKYDCIVCGAGPAGIASAISAKRNGTSVLLIENSPLLGGTNILSLVGPLMTFHNQGKQIIGGIASEIVERLIEINGSLGHIPDPLDFCSTVTPIDVESLKELYFKMIVEEKIDLLLHTRVIDVNKNGNSITSVKVVNKNGVYNIEGKVFIDATGDGDVCYQSKAKYILGREEDNLCQPMTMPFVVGNVDMDKLRTAMKNDPSNFVLRDNYNYEYIGISGFFKEVCKAKQLGDFDINRDRVLLFEDVKKNQVTVNMTRVLKLSGVDAVDLTKAEIEGRRQVRIAFKFLKKYIPGFENSILVQTPYQIGIRETRHIVCDYMMNKEDIFELRKFDDSIALGAFPMDIHSPTGDKMELDEIQNDKCYEIPLRVLLPVGLDNIIVTGRPIGATHEAAASIRVSPIVMALGEVAGTLASICASKSLNTRKVNVRELQDLLVQKGMIIKK